MAKPLIEVDIEVKGLQELEKQLQRLDKRTSRKVLRSAARKAFKPVLTRAKELAPESSREASPSRGKLKRALRLGAIIAPREVPRTRALEVGIIASKKARGVKDPQTGSRVKRIPGGHVWHWMEFGTTQRRHGSGKDVGAIAPRPFLRPAFDERSRQVLKDFGTILRKSILKVARRG